MKDINQLGPGSRAIRMACTSGYDWLTLVVNIVDIFGDDWLILVIRLVIEL